MVGDPTRHETFMGAVIDETRAAPPGVDHRPAKDLTGHHILTGGTVARRTAGSSTPRSSSPTTPTSFLMSKEFFGPLLTVHVYDDADWDNV